MIINVSDILSRKDYTETKSIELGLDYFESKLGRFRIADKSLVDLTLTNISSDKLLVEFVADLSIDIPCDRCLEDVRTDFKLNFSKQVSFSETDKEDSEAGYVVGYSLDVDKLVYDEILVNYPMKVLCSEDCKGICNSCGTNLNHGTCDCQSTGLDPRMSVIQDIFKEFKEV